MDKGGGGGRMEVQLITNVNVSSPLTLLCLVIGVRIIPSSISIVHDFNYNGVSGCDWTC